MLVTSTLLVLLAGAGTTAQDEDSSNRSLDERLLRASSHSADPDDDEEEEDGLDDMGSLLDAGANPNARDEGGRTPIFFLLGGSENSLTCSCDCWREDDDEEAECESRCLADRLTKLIEAAELLVKRGARTNVADRFGNTPLHMAARTGFTRAMDFLLRRGAKPSPKNRYGETPLHLAAVTGCEGVKRLLESKADPRARNRFGETALHYAVKGPMDGAVAQYFECLKNGDEDDCYVDAEPQESWDELEDYSCFNRVPVDARSKDGRTALHLAVMLGRVNAAAYLLGRGASTKTKDKRGLTPLHYAALDGEPSTVEAMLAAGAKPNLRFPDGDTLLFVATKNRNSEAARLLLKAGADPNLLSNERSPLAQAITNDDVKTVRHLLGAGADPNLLGPNVFDERCSRNQVKMIGLLLAAGWKNSDLPRDEARAEETCSRKKSSSSKRDYWNQDLSEPPAHLCPICGSARSTPLPRGKETCGKTGRSICCECGQVYPR